METQDEGKKRQGKKMCHKNNLLTYYQHIFPLPPFIIEYFLSPLLSFLFTFYPLTHLVGGEDRKRRKRKEKRRRRRRRRRLNKMREEEKKEEEEEEEEEE